MPWRVVRRTVRGFLADRCPTLAAAIAYGTLFAVIPVVALLIAGLGVVLRVPEMRRTVVERVLENVPIKAGVVVEAIRTLSEVSQPLTIVGLLGLLWTTMGLFGTVRDSLNIAWGVRAFRSLWQQKLIDLAAMLGLGLLFLTSIVGTTALHTVHDLGTTLLGRRSEGLDLVAEGVGVVFPAMITFVGFLLIYRYVPNVRHGFRDVWPGAVLAAWLFELAKHGFAYYVGHFSSFEVVYGSLGAVMLFLLWVYVSSAILLAGAELCWVLERSVWGRLPATRAQPDIVFGPWNEPESPPNAARATRSHHPG